MRRLLLILIVLVGFISAKAQNATVRGFVYDKKSGEPMMFCTVLLKGTSFGVNTDVHGYFSITKIPAGNYTLIATQIGYDSAIVKLSLKAGDVVTKKLSIGEAAIEIGAYEVSAERQEQVTQVKMSVTKLTPKEMEKLPAIGGEPDLAQYLQVLPGVIFTGSQGGQLYIRGGSPVQNKVLLDGMIIYNPFHSIGLFSVFDNDIMRNADIYTGGYGAQYGGRISSIMDITTKDGNKKRLSGKVQASSFGAKTMLEGPIKKSSSLESGSSSFIVSAKHSYLNETSPVLYDYVDSSGLPYSFTDLYGKVSFNSSNGSKLNLFGFNYSDKVNYPGVSNLNWNSYGVGSNFVLIPGKSKTLITGNFAYSSYLLKLSEEDGKPRQSGIDGFNMGMDFTTYNGDNQARYGFEIIGFNTVFQFFNSVNREISQNQSTTELAGYFTYRIVKGKLVVEPGFRAHYYASLSNFSPEPRIGLKYNVGESKKFRIKAAGGMYSQNLISAKSDRDVVNLFYGFLSGPDNLQNQFTMQNGKTRDVNHKLQKAIHAVLGFEYDIKKNFTANVEGYYKKFTQLTNINRNKIFDDTPENIDKPDELKKDFILESGDAYGVDFVFKYNTSRLSLYAVYSLMKVTRWDGTQLYSPVFDRRHNANFVGSYEFGKDRDWHFDVRWNLGSGFPFTKTQGFYEKFTFQQGVNTNYTNSNGNLGIQYAGINGGRLPYYHRLDLSIKKTFAISENSLLEVSGSITNVYNRKNVFYFNRITYQRVNQLPFLPSLGVSCTF